LDSYGPQNTYNETDSFSHCATLALVALSKNRNTSLNPVGVLRLFPVSV
jgi:hypothetical protein